MAEEEEEESELSDKHKVEIAKWFLLNSPPGEIQYVAKDVKSILNNDDLYNEAASEAFPFYNKSHLISLQMPTRSGDVLVTSFGELERNAFLDPRTTQVAVVDHVKQEENKKYNVLKTKRRYVVSTLLATANWAPPNQPAQLREMRTSSFGGRLGDYTVKNVTISHAIWDFVEEVGSNVTYDDSMNLRNILWLAPLPGDSAESWWNLLHPSLFSFYTRALLLYLCN
ncbi:F-actin-capping protein subunit alpha-2-like [Abrus precatorius]|uniref:F-actin-capping protein subunit alpha n=1 Tax=Abrus precatorius TaxID=3816 RepID=A0A8B8L4J6_ABRPR|nr:F-actin-capping protein subunit alpha-2-like [Abrus precatorius]